MDELNKEMKRLIGALNGAGYKVLRVSEYNTPFSKLFNLQIRKDADAANIAGEKREKLVAGAQSARAKRINKVDQKTGFYSGTNDPTERKA